MSTSIRDRVTNETTNLKLISTTSFIWTTGDAKRRAKAGEEWSVEKQMEARPQLMGQASAAIHAVEPASKIMDEMVAGALSSLRRGVGMAARL